MPTLRLPRLGCSISGCRCGSSWMPPMLRKPRWVSPRTGCSILMTSAPQSARMAPAAGTKVNCATSRTRTPSITLTISGTLLRVERHRKCNWRGGVQGRPDLVGNRRMTPALIRHSTDRRRAWRHFWESRPNSRYSIYEVAMLLWPSCRRRDGLDERRQRGRSERPVASSKPALYEVRDSGVAVITLNQPARQRLGRPDDVGVLPSPRSR